MRTTLFLLLFSILGNALASTESCQSACQDIASEKGRALCHSCRCKEAFDGWLPSQGDLQCGQGKEIVIYQTSKDSPLEKLPITTKVDTCQNPALFGGACAPGGRFGQMSHGDVHVKFICRRNSYSPDYQSPTLPFDKVSVIGTNMRTGATCFWESANNSISQNNMPDFDLAHADSKTLESYKETFPTTEGWGCLYCHDNDPFLYTPYLKSVNWQTDDYVDAPFARVLLQGKPKDTPQKMLTSAKADACTSCHRISTGRTCGEFAADAMGHAKGYGYEEPVIKAVDKLLEEDGKLTREAGVNPELAYWMPAHMSQFRWKQWHQRFGEAKETILKCCGEHFAGKTSPECRWEKIPGYQPD